MKQEEPKWLTRWDMQELPSLDELVPLTKALIPPDLALAFDIPTHINSDSNYVPTAAEAAVASGGGGGSDSLQQRQTPPLQPSQSQSQSHSQSLSQQQQQVEYDSSDVVGSGGGDEHERTLKKPRLVWTPQLHKRFVDAVGHLGIKNAVPKTIMQLMGVEGLKRENVASHLQKYRLYLKRMQGGHSSGGLNSSISAVDSAMDHLFASAPVPTHFLNRVPQQPQPASLPGSVPFTAPPGAGATQHQHHQQMLAAATHHYQHQRHVGQLGSDLGFQHHRMPGSGGGGIRMVTPPSSADGAGIRMMHHHSPLVMPYAEDLDSGCNNGSAGHGSGRRVLSLFPTNE